MVEILIITAVGLFFLGVVLGRLWELESADEPQEVRIVYRDRAAPASPPSATISPPRVRWKPGTVVRDEDGTLYVVTKDSGDRSWVQVRRKGKTDKGRRYPRRVMPLNRLTEVSPPNPLTANVFADWLQENGHDKAGEALRQKFPLIGED